jgi:chitin deacetylase
MLVKSLFISSLINLSFSLIVPEFDKMDKRLVDNPSATNMPVGWDATAQAQQPFPQWLADFTQLDEWPGLDPPYIPLDYIDFDKIQDYPPYQQGICPGTRDSCAFDCWNCIEPDDVFTCPKLSQSFDDGPSPSTPKLLKHLENKTTFFTLGINVVRYPEIYRLARDEGHLLGSHTWSHKFLPSLTNEEIITQIEWSIWAQNATGNHFPKWFRPPYGGIDNRVRSILRQFGMQAVIWNYDTYDWRLMLGEKQEDQILDEVEGWKSEGPSGLILEHDAALPTVNAGIKINDLIGSDQLTVAECVGGVDYIEVFQ